MSGLTNILDAPVTYLPLVRNPSSFEAMPLKRALKNIKSGAYKDSISKLRTIYILGEDDEYKQKKKLLPSFAFHGTFKKIVSNDGFAQSSGLFHIDVDGLDAEQMASTRQLLADDPRTVFVFISPSGCGLKAAFRVDPDKIKDDKSFKIAFAQISQHLADRGIRIDPSCKDVRRICFVSYDPDLYYNKNAVEFSLDQPALPTQNSLVEDDDPDYVPITEVDRFAPDEPVEYPPNDGEMCVKLILGILKDSTEGERHLARGKAGMLAGGYIAAGRLDEKLIKKQLKAVSDEISANGETDPIEWGTVTSAIKKGKEVPLYEPHYGAKAAAKATRDSSAMAKAERILEDCDDFNMLMRITAPRLWRLADKNVSLEKDFTAAIMARYSALRPGYSLTKADTLRAMKMRHANDKTPIKSDIVEKMKRDDAGKFLPGTNNVVMAVGCPEFCGLKLGKDEFTDTVMFHTGDGQWQNFCDKHYTALKIALDNRNFHEVPTERMREAVHLVSDDNRFDSAQLWLNSLKWDGVARVGRYLENYLGTPDTPYTKAVSFYMWTAMAGRILVPGIKADMVPILKGGQGTFKTTSVQSLVPASEYFTHFSFKEKEDDISRKFRGVLVAELGELRGLDSSQSEHIKDFIARQCEKWVPKYKEYAATYLRRVIIIGTTNEDQFLHDSTGNRRFLPFEVGCIDTDAIVRDRNQLWAEGAEIFKRHGVVYDEAEKLAVHEHKQFEAVDDWEALVAQFLNQSLDSDIDGFDVSLGVSTLEIQVSAIGLEAKYAGQQSKRRIGAIMKNLGYCNRQCRREGVKGYYWFKGEALTTETETIDLSDLI